MNVIQRSGLIHEPGENNHMKNCSFCGAGKLHPKTLSYVDQPWGAKTYRFENVSALVCDICGEVYFEAAVSQAMDKVLEDKPAPKRVDQVPVFELPTTR